MAQIGMRRLILVVSFGLALLIGGVAAEGEPSRKSGKLIGCAVGCVVGCIVTHEEGLCPCITDCVEKCKPAPAPPLDDDVTKCTFSCANSSCNNFTSDADQLEGCVDSCYRKCSHGSSKV